MLVSSEFSLPKRARSDGFAPLAAVPRSCAPVSSRSALERRQALAGAWKGGPRGAPPTLNSLRLTNQVFSTMKIVGLAEYPAVAASVANP